MEEQLDELVSQLKRSWTEQRLVTELRHGVPTVQDFAPLYDTVTRSRLTLKQLGSSQYSTEMKAQLLEWHSTVGSAEEALDVFKSAQGMFLRLDLALGSMVVEEELGATHAHFKVLRGKVERAFDSLAGKASLMDACGDAELVGQMRDLSLGLEEAATAVKTVLYAMRSSSPR